MLLLILFPVEVKLANTRQRIRPGMFGRVTVSFGTLRHVVVPDQAIVKRAGSGDRYVYVYKDGKVSYNKVELGRRMGTEYELISGWRIIRRWWLPVRPVWPMVWKWQ